MEFSHLSLVGAFAMLVFGVADYAILQRMLYIPLRDRYERAKVTGSQGVNPSVIWNVLRFVNFVVLPVLGFLFGHSVLKGFTG